MTSPVSASLHPGALTVTVPVGAAAAGVTAVMVTSSVPAAPEATAAIVAAVAVPARTRRVPVSVLVSEKGPLYSAVSA